MVRLAFAAFILAFCVGSEPAVAEVESPLKVPRIYWRNGDSLDGKMISASDDELSWTSRVFADPLRLRHEAVHMIRFPVRPQDLGAKNNSKAQVIETRDGNRFFGFVKDSTPDTLIVDTYQYGEIRIHRDAVSLIANPVERARVYSGPKGLRGWSTVTYGRKLSEWEEVPGGRLTTKMVAAELYRSLPANGSVDIDVELIWRHNPSFQIRFLTPYGKSTKETVKLETRAASYVIQTLGSNGRFRQLESIPKGTTKSRFLLRWNQSASELAVYRGRRYLGKISVDRQETLGTAGIYIKNTGPQLTLSRLEIRARSKLDINLTDPTKDTILRADNQSVSGRVTYITNDKVTFTDSEQKSVDLPWSEIPEISFRQQSNDFKARPGDTECISQNGETLKGRLLRADVQGLTIQVSSMEGPIRIRYDGIERIIFNAKSVPPGKHVPQLLAGDVSIHGKMAPTVNGQIGWLPVGGVESVRTAEHIAARFELKPHTLPFSPLAWGKETGGGKPVSAARPPIQNTGSVQDDVVYLRSGDVIPCKVHEVNPDQLTLSSRFAEDRVVASRDIKAVELSAPPVKPIKGFDRHWEVKDPTKAQVDETSVSFVQPTVAQHPHILKGCDQIEFVVSCKLGKTRGAFLQVTLHGEENVQRTIPFYFSGKQSFVMGNRGNAFQLIEGDTDRFSVNIQMQYPYSISVNGRAMNSKESSSQAEKPVVPWLELSFAMTQAKPFLNRRLALAGGTTELIISDLVVSQTRRAAISHTTAALDSKPLLTVPRHRKSESVTHLAIGTNNDIVRGRLLSLDAKTVQLECSSRKLYIPRETLSGLIWLENHQHDSSETTPGVRMVLRDTTTFGLEGPTLSDGCLHGHHPQLGLCKIPADEIHTLLWGDAQSRLHQFDFLSWSATDARQPSFTSNQDARHRIESDLVGKRLDLEVELIDSSKRFRLSEQIGRIVVIEFWATWCAPCVKNMPMLIETMRDYSPDQAGFVAVNQGEHPLVVTTMIAAKGWNMAIGLDPEGHASQTFKVQALPQTVIVDRNGKIAAVFVGATSGMHAELKATIDRLLEE